MPGNRLVPVDRSTALAKPATDERVSLPQMAAMVRRRWLIIAATLLLSIGAAVAYLVTTPPTFEASASILVEEKPYNLPEIVTRPEDEADIATQLEVLRSAHLAGLVVRDLALRVKVVTPSGVPRSELFDSLAIAGDAEPGEIELVREGGAHFRAMIDGRRGPDIETGRPVALGRLTVALSPEAARHERIALEILPLAGVVADLQDQLTIVRPDRNANVIWIRYRSQDPEQTRAVPNLLAEHYIDARIESARSRVRAAATFLREEADTLRRQLLAADAMLQQYRQRQGIVSLPDEATTEVIQTGELRSKRATLEAERAALARVIADADTASRDGPSVWRRLTAFPTLIDNPVVANHMLHLNKLESDRATLMVRRTPNDPEVQAMDRQIAIVDEALRGVTLTYLDGLTNQVAGLDRAIGSRSRRAASIPMKTMEEQRLARQPDVLSEVYELVETRLQEARIAESATDPGVTVIDRAPTPRLPVWPRSGLVLAVATAIGLLAGGGLAWMREGMDASVHSRADVVEAAGERVLGMVPRIRSTNGSRADEARLAASPIRAVGSFVTPKHRGRSRPRTAVAAQLEAPGPVLEAYTWLETSLALNEPEGGLRTVAFTSPLPREGKTLNATNLALSTARRGRRVLLVDADLRRGLIHRMFGLDPEPGLAEVLAGAIAPAAAIRRIPLGGGLGLDVLPRGGLDRHPVTLLGAASTREIFARLEQSYDLLLIDSPPVNLVSDSLLLSRFVDGVVLVARAGMTDVGALTEATRHLRDAGAPLLGVLLNDIDLQRDGSYDEAYRYLDQAGAYAEVAEP